MGKTTGLLGSVALVLTLSLGGAAVAQDIDFGDDTSAWANDGQCDDPRFEGPGAATFSVSADEMRDATDCRTAFEAGEVTVVSATPEPTPPAPTPPSPTPTPPSPTPPAPTPTPPAPTPPAPTPPAPTPPAPTPPPPPSGDIDFGDDSGAFPGDGECDDPRFTGPGVWSGANETGLLADATDCQAAVTAGTATFVGDSGIDFGDDTGPYPMDGECDDPRFTGPGVWSGANDEGIRGDATDCQAAVEAGTAEYSGEVDAAPVTGDVDFGDDSGPFPMDGECDDPRFAGEGVWTGANEEGVRTDATDCEAAVAAGTAEYVGEYAAPEPIDPVGMVDGVDFGDNSSTWANDGECDDGRFSGDGMGLTSLTHAMMDANDCLAAFQAGTVTYVGDGTEISDAPAINFGDDSGVWANDGECDDARFEGAGMGVQDANHVMADATDCRAAFDAGSITLIQGDAGDTSGEPAVNFGDDSSALANDGVCDDPRFQGRGAASLLYNENQLADATDCRAAYDAGTVILAI